MKKNFKNMAGKKIGRLTVLKISHSTERGVFWVCLCKCGNKVIVKGYSLRCGETKSCGCLHSDSARKIQRKYQWKHGKSGTKIYTTWKQIQIRCNKKSDKAYRNYGGRGIKCLWKTFPEFYKDMGNPPSELYSIDRIDNNSNYCKENCRWATKTEQANNRRTAHLLTYEGKTQNMKSWAIKLGIPYRNLWWRIKNGWSIEEAFSKRK